MEKKMWVKGQDSNENNFAPPKPQPQQEVTEEPKSTPIRFDK